MATKVAGELYESITGQLFEIGRQLRQPQGYPYDPIRTKKALQAIIEGRFSESEPGFLSTTNLDSLPAGYPYTDGWEIAAHEKYGFIQLKENSVGLYYSPRQLDGKPERGRGLQMMLKDLRPANLALMDYYMIFPGKIPEEWLHKYVYFWGTTFVRNYGRTRVFYVRYLYYKGNYRYETGLRPVQRFWHHNAPAAVLNL
jgi:hypothetical protein